MAFLENLLKESRPDVAVDHYGREIAADNPSETSPATSSVMRPGPPHPYDQGWGAQPRPTAVDASGGEDILSDEVALLCLGAAGREPQYFGPSSALSFSRIASSVMGLARRGGTTSSRPSGVNGQSGARQRPQSDASLKTRLAKAFPSPDKMALLSQAYFENIHVQYPFLHRPTVQSMERQCRNAQARDELSEADDAYLFFMLMV